MKKLWITSDCTCDLSDAFLTRNDLKVMYFYIKTDHGYFRDLDEMTAANVVEYFQNGGQEIGTYGPKPYEYEEFFAKKLQKYDEIIHIAFSSKIGTAYKHAVIAAEKFDGRVHIFDTESLSTGMAHCVLKAMELVQNGKDVEEVLAELEAMKNKISVSFIAENLDTLYRAGRVNKFLKNVCSVFLIHPVLTMSNGELKLKGVQIGNFENCVLRYVRKELRKSSQIKRDRLFLTYSTCSLKLLDKVKKQIEKKCSFDEVLEATASATVTSNCGANSIGVVFVRE